MFEYLDSVVDDLKKREAEDRSREAGFFYIRTANECIKDASKQKVPRDLFHSLIFEKEITFLFADTGVGKSIFAVQIANEISSKQKVLYLDLELSEKQFENRYSQNYDNHYKFNDNLYRIDFQRQFSLPQGVHYDDFFIESIIKLIDKTGAKIIIIDNMTKLISSDTDSAKSAKPLMDKLCDLKFEYGLTLLLLEHTRKTDMSRPVTLNDLQGSKMKSNFADAAFCIGRSSKHKNLRYIKQLKCRSAEIIYDASNVPVYELTKEDSFLKFKFVGYEYEYEHLRYQTEDNDKEQIVSQILELKEQGLSNREIAHKLGISEGTVRYRVKSLANPS
ncbi:AAA family ATPase [Dysgonomonas sp. ZJ709]|uniref:AAA family ATPase n=1 Tax=Dysgonomonas sp. ZJ709 TaxID=2709797 RepID=UPI0013EA61C2|nr:AAA family ATPase [Dysgonomonas sp. ZJ709]